MNKTPLKQKLLLVFLGVILAFILLEIGLRLAGYFVLYLQQRHDHVSFSPNEYRILCLGESTTALGGEDSYPGQLEEILNAENHPLKYTVINKGIISTTTKYILDHLDGNLDRYRPQMVIVMMGINDKAYLHDTHKVLWFERFKSGLNNFRTVKLAHLLVQHISHRLKGDKVPLDKIALSDEDTVSSQKTEEYLKLAIDHYVQQIHTVKGSQIAASILYVELSRRYRLQGKFRDARNMLVEATLLYPAYAGLYREWGDLELSLGKSNEAAKAYQTSLALDPSNTIVLQGLARAYYQGHNIKAFGVYMMYLNKNSNDYWGYIELAKWLNDTNQIEIAEGLLARAIELGPDLDQAYVDMAQLLDKHGSYQKEEAFLLKEISLHPKNPRLYEALGEFYRKQNREDLAKGYFQKAAKEEIAEYYPDTFVNYSLLADKILKRHIKMIVMQYPLRDIMPLKEYLGDKKGIIYVENKLNFKNALMTGGYDRYFKDNFAFNFGHCTRAGNLLIARNLSEVIIKNE